MCDLGTKFETLAVTGVNRPRSTRVDERVARQVRREVGRHPDRAHARSPAAVRDAERLVQVQVTDVGANRGGAREPHLRVHVRAVHVHLAAVPVNNRADILDAVLEHAVR